MLRLWALLGQRRLHAVIGTQQAAGQRIERDQKRGHQKGLPAHSTATAAIRMSADKKGHRPAVGLCHTAKMASVVTSAARVAPATNAARSQAATSQPAAPLRGGLPTYSGFRNAGNAAGAAVSSIWLCGAVPHRMAPLAPATCPRLHHSAFFADPDQLQERIRGPHRGAPWQRAAGAGYGG